MNRIEAHDETLRTKTTDIVATLVDQLGPTLVALLAGVRDRKLPYRWRTGGVEPRTEALVRLMGAYELWLLLSTNEGPDIARAWFIGCNPRLDDEQPVQVIRDGQMLKAMAAAQAFVDGVPA